MTGLEVVLLAALGVVWTLGAVACVAGVRVHLGREVARVGVIATFLLWPFVVFLAVWLAAPSRRISHRRR